MGVYIKGMEMPVTCCHCPLLGYDPDIEWNDGGRETQGAYICVITHDLIDNTKREEHCPLVPVPPHGRLIDADATIEVWEVKLSDGDSCSFRNIETTVSKFLLFHLMGEIPPTIIPAEEGET